MYFWNLLFGNLSRLWLVIDEIPLVTTIFYLFSVEEVISQVSDCFLETFIDTVTYTDDILDYYVTFVNNLTLVFTTIVLPQVFRLLQPLTEFSNRFGFILRPFQLNPFFLWIVSTTVFYPQSFVKLIVSEASPDTPLTTLEFAKTFLLEWILTRAFSWHFCPTCFDSMPKRSCWHSFLFSCECSNNK